MKANVIYVLQHSSGKFYCSGLTRPLFTEHLINAKHWKMKYAAVHKQKILLEQNGWRTEIFPFQLLPKVERSRPNWDDYFMGLAFVISQRSHDKHTAHGCVIVDCDNHIIGTGYNGFPKGLGEDWVDNKKIFEPLLERPEKYKWMIHSEVNAISNCVKSPKGATAYVTGECCNGCLMHMWQNGITQVIQAERLGSVLIDEKTRERKEFFLQQMQRHAKSAVMIIKTVPVNTTWLLPCVI